MDRKGIIILVVCGLLLMAGYSLVDQIFKPIPVPVSTNQVAMTTNLVGSNTAGSNAVATPAMAGGAPGVKFVVRPEIPEELLVVTNEIARYTFTSRGGGLKTVELLKYPETVTALRHRQKGTNEVASLNTPVAPPVMALVGDESLQDDGVYKLTQITNGVRAEKTLTNGLTVTKDFQMATESSYLVSVTVHLKNQSKQAVTVPVENWVGGTATPMGPQDTSLAEAVMWYNGTKANSVGVSYFNTNTTTLGLFSRTPRAEFSAGSNDVAWVSAQNQFFTLAIMPASNTPAMSLGVRMVDLPRPSEEEIAAVPRTVRSPEGLEAVLAYPAVRLEPDQQQELRFNLFAGPKEYRRLSQLSDRLNNRIDLVMGFGNWYGPISKVLLVAMNWVHQVLGFGYGLIVVLITVTLRFVFWPITRASTRSMKRMQELQPQMKAMQAKYKDDPAKLQQKTWEFYKKNKVNPLGGCLPMVLQVPVFFGFFGMLRNAIELRGARFLWIGDLSQPDTIFMLPGFNFPVNLMPLLMAGAQFWQASLTPLSPGVDPAQQKMMRYMPLLMVVFFYNYSSGLALYWTVSTLMTVLQTKLTKTQTPAPAAAVPAPARPPQKKK